MVASVRMALNRSALPAGEIRRIGVSGQQHGLVVLDAAGTAIRPAEPSNDTKTAPDDERRVAAFGGPAVWFEKVGVIPAHPPEIRRAVITALLESAGRQFHHYFLCLT
jgi:xylulokinase